MKRIVCIFVLSLLFCIQKGNCLEKKVLITSNPKPGYTVKRLKSTDTTSDAPLESPRARADSPTKAVVAIGKDSRLSIGGIYSYVSIQTATYYFFEGNMGGVDALYEYRPLDFFYLGAQFFWKQGSTFCSGAPRRDILDLLLEERVGYTMNVDEPGSLLKSVTPYTGIGFRWNSNKYFLPEFQGIDNYYQYYIPVGFLLHCYATNRLSFDCNIAWLPQIDPSLSRNTIKNIQFDVNYKLINFSVSVPLTYTISDQYAMTLTPFIQWWENGSSLESITKLSSGEWVPVPENVYCFAGVSFSAAICF